MKLKTDVLVVGAGTSGVCAAIQAARLGVKVIVVEETEWVGGMLTAAGVSAIDGNHKLPSGLWGEFRQKLYDYYGGPQKVETGWVSNTLFEPKVGEQILRKMLQESGSVKMFFGYFPVKALLAEEQSRLCGMEFQNEQGETLTIEAPMTIEATEFGDVLALSNVPFYYGRESTSQTGEPGAPAEPDDWVQDLTHVAVLKDFGPQADKTIEPPENYDPLEFKGCCKEWYGEQYDNAISAQAMLDYGRLPNQKFMINWPKNGNDYFSHIAIFDRQKRKQEIAKAKATTLRFVYFIQTQLGFKHLGVSPEDFPTTDHLALIPYIRESRRVKGRVLFSLQHILHPYASDAPPLYQQGIAVGNYPLDHHHDKALKHSNETYPSIPAFTVPYGTLVPKEMKGLLVAEKSISVTHMVNGCTRLQPVVMQIGQAAGAAAVLALKQNANPALINVRELQKILLESQMWLMPFTDMTPQHWAFKAMQRTALCGLLKGQGKAKDWANEFYINPEKPIKAQEAVEALQMLRPDFQPNEHFEALLQTNQSLTRLEGVRLIWEALGRPQSQTHLFLNDVQHLAVDFICEQNAGEPWIDFKNERFYPKEPMTRSIFAFLLDRLFKPFEKPLFIE